MCTAHIVKHTLEFYSSAFSPSRFQVLTSLSVILLSRKRKYQRYHFDSIDQLEFYRSNRVVFKGRKIRGAVMSELVETTRVGKQKIKWDDTAEIRVIIFDKLPDQITDMVKKENLGVGEKICASDTYLMDWAVFLKCVDKEFKTKEK